MSGSQLRPRQHALGSALDCGCSPSFPEINGAARCSIPLATTVRVFGKSDSKRETSSTDRWVSLGAKAHLFSSFALRSGTDDGSQAMRVRSVSRVKLKSK